MATTMTYMQKFRARRRPATGFIASIEMTRFNIVDKRSYGFFCLYMFSCQGWLCSLLVKGEGSFEFKKGSQNLKDKRHCSL